MQVSGSGSNKMSNTELLRGTIIHSFFRHFISQSLCLRIRCYLVLLYLIFTRNVSVFLKIKKTFYPKHTQETRPDFFFGNAFEYDRQKFN